MPDLFSAKFWLLRTFRFFSTFGALHTELAWTSFLSFLLLWTHSRSHPWSPVQLASLPWLISVSVFRLACFSHSDCWLLLLLELFAACCGAVPLRVCSTLPLQALHVLVLSACQPSGFRCMFGVRAGLHAMDMMNMDRIGIRKSKQIKSKSNELKEGPLEE